MIKVQIKNFQSIEEAEVEIDGFTVITGPNNSGKSAVMRAIRGVFTNAPAGPLVRKGAKNLSVGILFPDGTDVLWEKGGKVNRYTLNGKELNSVGRGVPPEVAALGVAEVKAASDRIWPQIAEQFTGSLFLVNRPGSVVAEALSDVDRVGKLTEALRLSESDRRSCSSELKVRRKDLNAFREAAAMYEGLDAVLDCITTLEDRQAALKTEETTLAELGSLNFQWKKHTQEAVFYEGFNPDAVPTSEQAVSAQKLKDAVAYIQGLQKRHQRSSSEVVRTEGLDAVVVPDPKPAAQIRKDWKGAKALNQRLEAAQRESQKYGGSLPQLPSAAQAEKIKKAIEVVSDYESRVKDAADKVADLDIRIEKVREDLEESKAQVQILLGSRGVCPTCGAVCETQHLMRGEA
jgi:DNA repair ATPase RecN